MQVSREERTFQVNVFVEWCVSGFISGEARGAFAPPPPLDFVYPPLCANFLLIFKVINKMK